MGESGLDSSAASIPAASAVYLASIGNSGALGLTITQSKRTARSRFSLFSAPIRSPLPTIPPDNVAISTLSASVLMNTSVHGQMPSALAKRDVYRNVSHLDRVNRSPLVRMVVRFP